MIYRSKQIGRLLDEARRYAQSDSTVLIQGESGTGKELIARHLHHCSPRASRPYLKINCGAFAENLIDSALFGHERGAFTGADRQQAGCFEAAGDGTLFLDEIGELPLPMQTRLLRVLEDHEFFRVGSYTAQRAHARILAATNRDLQAEVAAGRFRGDLYYRISMLCVRIPPLRERREDIPVLSHHFLNDGPAADVPRSFSEPALRKLTAYDWPGNVRELSNVVQRARLTCDASVVDDVQLDSPISIPFPNDQELHSLRGLTLRQIEQMVMRDRVRYLGTREAAAESLGITARTLRNRLNKSGPASTERTADDTAERHGRPQLKIA